MEFWEKRSVGGFSDLIGQDDENAQIFCPSPAKLKLFKVPRRGLVFWCSSSSFNWNKTMKQRFSRLLKKQLFSEVYRRRSSILPLVCVIHDITKSSSFLFRIILNFVWLLDIQTGLKNIFHSCMRIGNWDETPYNLSNWEPKFWLTAGSCSGSCTKYNIHLKISSYSIINMCRQTNRQTNKQTRKCHP